MTEQRYRLLALDMDGTLLTSDKQVSPRTHEALRELVERGVPVCYCTGRNVAELMDYPDELPFMRYGVLSSGAVVYDFAEKHVLFSTVIDDEAVLAAIEIAGVERPMVHVMSIRDSIARPSDIAHMDRFQLGVYQGMFERICVQVDDLAGWVRTHPAQVAKLNFYHRDLESRVRTLQRLEAAGLPISMAFSEAASLECSTRGISKAEGLRILARHLGFSVDEVVAVGDGDNDLEALRAVGMPVGMGNATAGVKQIARLIVADNDHDGIAEVVARLFA